MNNQHMDVASLTLFFVVIPVAILVWLYWNPKVARKAGESVAAVIGGALCVGVGAIAGLGFVYAAVSILRWMW